ncbi:MAG: DUF5678 domain-containing protein [Acidobacteriota bacterium]
MPTAKLQEILDAVQTLPPTDRQILREFLNKPPSLVINDSTVEMRSTEMNWLAEHEAEYAGQWLALDGDRLLAQGTDLKQVMTEARAAGVGDPFFAYAEDPRQAQWGGWV